jgi:4-amino-4-deoxy-L-arabinose transferase-like glycosyltransferase
MFTFLSSLPWLPCILAGALALRIVAAVAVQHWVEGTPGRLCLIKGDAAGYWELARHLSRGEDFAIYDPPRYVERMPGFPLFLAGAIKLFGEPRLLWMRILLAGVGTGACGLVYWLGRELVDHETGLVASLLAAVSPMFVVFSVLFLSETLFALALLASLVALARLLPDRSGNPANADSNRTKSLALTAGLLSGAATLIRPTWILVAPAFAMVYLFAIPHPRQRLLPAMILVAALALTLTPWTFRNYRVTGHFVATTLWVGPSLYDGLNLQATGDSDMAFIESDGRYARGQGADFEYQADRAYRRQALDFVIDNPARTVVLAVKKLGRFLNPFPNAGQFKNWTVYLGVGLFELPVLGLALAGFWQHRANWRIWLLAAGALLYFALVHTVFVGSVRYRLPAEYPLLVLTVIGARWAVQRGKRLWLRRAPDGKGVAPA